MKDNYTYQPEDIEALLVAKKFDELLEEEKQFVLQHLDSKQEYVQMRNTLLAIKQATKNDNQIKPDEIVKDKLLAMFEEQKNKAAWWRLNSIGAFLFPSDVSLVRKPGFQLASFAALLAIMLTIGNNVFSPNTQSELAINQPKNKKLDKAKVNNNSIEKRVLDAVVDTENDRVAEPIINNPSLTDEADEVPLLNENANGARLNEMFDQAEQSSKTSAFEVIERERVVDFIESDDLALEITEDEEELMEENVIEEEVSEVTVSANKKASAPASPILKDGISDVQQEKKAKTTRSRDSKGYLDVSTKLKDDKQTIANSQSLADSENLIDLLEVIL